MTGYQTIGNTINYVNKKVDVIRELGSYALITYNGSELGWVDKKALEFSTEVSDVPSSVPVSYKAGISKSGYSIDTMPWGTAGYQTIAKTTDYIGTEVDVIRKKGSYVLIFFAVGLKKQYE